MNKTAIKNYAIWARVQLIEAAKQRAYEYEITENGENKSGLDMVGGRLLTKTEKEQRNQLISEINRKGFSQVMEEAAYTWFNRFIALRFMEVNGYLPSKVRVFTDENGAFRPEILKQAMSVELEGLERNKVLDLLDRQDNEELYKYLLITQCNALNAGLPYMFEKISNWTELLFPANLLRTDSVIGQMISGIPEDDWTDAVQIIGWLYQYYNSELKDETFALLKKNVKITKERIPAATQLFTPDWIVRYMVENSLGRLWYEGHQDFDKSQWKYYLDEAKQEPEVEAQLQKIRAEYAAIRPEEIKVIDPCMGSGHILVYAFDVLMQIYTSSGWSERDAAKSILENNLYGLDIDDRAGQLAYFAVMMKARKHSRRILNGEVKLNVLSIQDSNWMTDEFIAYVAGKDANLKADLVMLRKTFRDAKEYGSILNVPAMHYDAIYERIDIISRSYAEDLFQAQFKAMAMEQLLTLVTQSQIMSQKYDVVVTNPPYMGSRKSMNPALKTFVERNYPDSKSDLYTVFIEKAIAMTKINGKLSLVTQQSFMFTDDYKELRIKLINSIRFINMAHLGADAFPEISGEVVQTTAFVIENNTSSSYKARFSRLVDFSCEDKPRYLLEEGNTFFCSSRRFSNIKAIPFSYWLSDAIRHSFDLGKPFEDYGNPRAGITTGDNDSFMRCWHEVSFEKIGLNYKNVEEFHSSQKLYIPYNKGGRQIRWYGNNDYVLMFDPINYERLSNQGNHLPSRQYYCKRCITWSDISSRSFAARYCNNGAVFDVKGSCGFPNEKNYWLSLAFLNSKLTPLYIDALNPTTTTQVGDLKRMPIISPEPELHDKIDLIAQSCVSIAKDFYDSEETSWDFKKHPLI